MRILFLIIGALIVNLSALDKELVKDMGKFTHNPLGFVNYTYSWGEGDLVGEGSDGPRQWQKEILNKIGSHLSNPETVHTPLKIAVSSGHGIGKSACISWIIDWGMSTCEDCKIVVTANTENQLRTKTWPEITKWFNRSINSHWFKPTATAIVSSQSDHEKQWRADAVPWSENNTEAFAGLHNAKKRIILVFDEASSIADAVWEVAEGALTDKETEIIWIAFGNPTRSTGRFRECFGKFKHRWNTVQIDSRTVEGTNKEQIQEWVDDFGEDSDFVRVRVRGVFPSAGSCQFISSSSVANCKNFIARNWDKIKPVFGVDVARFGDDQNALCMRQGRKVHPFKKWRGLDTMQTAGRVFEAYKEFKPSHVFVDGGGVGGGVIDRLKELIPEMGVVVEVNFGSSASDQEKYANKRAEIWGLTRDAIKAGLELPEDNELTDELTAVEYGFTSKQQILLEKKEDMKKRGLSSPDCADALCLTFEVPPPTGDYIVW
jgi:hypothetical protein